MNNSFTTLSYFPAMDLAKRRLIGDRSDLFVSSFTRPLWIVVDVGCICCLCDSDIVGVFTDPEEANAVIHRLSNEEEWQGGHSFELFLLPSVNQITPKYLPRIPV